MKDYNARKALVKVNKALVPRKSISWKYYLQKTAAILFIPLLIGSISYIFYMSNRKIGSEIVWQTVETVPGQKSFIELPDGTQVWLNSETKLTYSLPFCENSREIRLTGEAFFEVVKMDDCPFHVDLGEIGVKVLGTEFNISNYATDNSARIYLNSGNVQIYSTGKENESVLANMNPGEIAFYQKDSKEISLDRRNSEISMAWMEGKLVFRDEAMTDVVGRLNRWFNVDIEIIDPVISEYSYTATFQHESLEQVLELLKISAPIDYKIQSREKNKNNMYTKNKVELYKP